jgi:hypothetical protein
MWLCGLVMMVCTSIKIVLKCRSLNISTYLYRGRWVVNATIYL